MDFSYNKGLAPIAIEKTKILGAVLELPGSSANLAHLPQK